MSHLCRAAALGAVLSFAAAFPLAAADVPKPAAPEKMTSVEGITEYRLANGLKVILFPDPSKPTITVNITYLVGSRHEGYGETGMAHLLEHMVFKGTPKHKEIWRELTEHGTRPNGTTWFDRTNYFETFDATDANLEWALDLESDRMVNSFIAKKDLDSEMTVVRNQFEAGENDPSEVLLARIYATAYLWHGYGRDTIGARSDIENVPIERLQAFYRNYYQPDNAVLVVAGKFDEAKTLGPSRTASARSRCDALATSRSSRPVTTSPPGATPTRPVSTSSRSLSATRLLAASTRPSSRRRRRPPPSASRRCSGSRASRSSAPRSGRNSPSKRHATSCSGPSRTPPSTRRRKRRSSAGGRSSSSRSTSR